MSENTTHTKNNRQQTTVRKLTNSDKERLDVLKLREGLTLAQAISKALDAYEEQHGKLSLDTKDNSN